jgi:hypothetical protein
MNLIEQMIDLFEMNLDDKDAAKLINHNKQIVALLRHNKDLNVRMNELLRQAKGVTPTAATDEPARIKMKAINFSPAEFNAPNLPPQPAPPVDTEIKAQAVQEADPNEKQIFELFNLGQEKAEAEYGLEGFVSKAKELGATYKKAPKTFQDAWAVFEHHFRKTLSV